MLKWHSFGAPGESGTKWTGGLSFSEYFVWQRGTKPLTRASLNRGAQALLSWPNPSSNMLDRVARTARGGGSAPALCPKLSKAKKERVPIAPTVGVKNTPVSRKASSVTNLREKGAPWCGSVTRTSPRRKEGKERERETDGHGEREREKRMRARGRGVPLVAKGEEDRQKDGERESARDLLTAPSLWPSRLSGVHRPFPMAMQGCTSVAVATTTPESPAQGCRGCKPLPA